MSDKKGIVELKEYDREPRGGIAGSGPAPSVSSDARASETAIDIEENNPVHQTGSDGDIGGDGDTGSDGDTSSNSDAGSDGGHVGNKVQGPEMEPEITEAIKSGKVSEVDAWIQSKGGDVKTIIYKGKYTALHLAAKANSLELITKLLPAGDPNARVGEKKQTALHVLCASKKTMERDITQCAEKLLSEMSPASIDAGDSKGRTALHYAVRRKPVAVAVTVADMLLDGGADPSKATTGNKRTPAHRTALLGNTELLERMIRIDNGCVFKSDENNETALHWAAAAGKFEAARAICDAAPSDLDIKTMVSRGNLLNYAARGGSADLTRFLIQYYGIPIDPDLPEYKKSPLQDAVEYGYIDTAVVLVENNARVTSELFMEIVEKGYKELAMAAMNRSDWHKILLGEEGHKSKYSRLSCRDKVNTPFREMIRTLPEVAKFVLDKCIVEGNYKDNPYHVNYKVAYNYEFIDDFWENELEAPGTEPIPEYDYLYVAERKWKKRGPKGFNKQNHPLSIMVRHACKDLLYHPVVLALVNQKWRGRTHGLISWILNFAFYVIFLTSLTSFALVVQNPQVGECPPTSCPESSSTRRIFTSVASAIVILSACLRLLIELFQLLIQRFYYFSDWVNWIELILFPCSISFAAMPISNWICPCVCNWQWQVGVVAVFLAWCDFIVYTSKLPFVGIYVLMFFEVIKTFLKLAVLTLLLIITFGLSFYMLFSTPGSQVSPFSTEILSMIRTLMMTTGEMDYDGIFRHSLSADDNSTVTELPFAPVAYILWIPFVILIPVLFANMLIGLAVGDTSTVLAEAEFRLLAQKIDQVLSVEQLYYQLWYLLSLVCKCNARCTRWIKKKRVSKGKSQQHVIQPNEKPNYAWWQKFTQWLNTFFGVEQHRFNTLEVINNVKRPEVPAVAKEESCLCCKQQASTVQMTTAVAAGLEKVTEEVDEIKRSCIHNEQQGKLLRQEIAEIKEALFGYQQLLEKIAEKCNETGSLIPERK